MAKNDNKIIASHTVAAEHNAAAARSFAGNFVNIYSIFNAGAFAACIAIVPTTFGKNIIALYPWTAALVFGCFMFAFLFSTVLMIILFVFSLKKYKFHRFSILGDEKFIEKYNDPGTAFGPYVSAGIVLFFTIIPTITGTLCGLYLFFAAGN